MAWDSRITQSKHDIKKRDQVKYGPIKRWDLLAKPSCCEPGSSFRTLSYKSSIVDSPRLHKKFAEASEYTLTTNRYNSFWERPGMLVYAMANNLPIPPWIPMLEVIRKVEPFLYKPQHAVFLSRIADTIRMKRNGIPAVRIIQEHGRIVLREAEYLIAWKRLKTDGINSTTRN